MVSADCSVEVPGFENMLGFLKLNSNVNVSMPTSPLTLVILKNWGHELDKSVLFIQVYELQC